MRVSSSPPFIALFCFPETESLDILLLCSWVFSPPLITRFGRWEEDLLRYEDNSARFIYIPSRVFFSFLEGMGLLFKVEEFVGGDEDPFKGGSVDDRVVDGC